MATPEKITQLNFPRARKQLARTLSERTAAAIETLYAKRQRPGGLNPEEEKRLRELAARQKALEGARTSG